MDSKEIIALLNQEPEMNPDLHDGSYELMREIVESYSNMDDYSELNYKDLNAIYAMALGTWKLNVEKKKEYVYASHLPDDEKQTLANIIDDVWDKACRGKYNNRESKGPSIGMFGTGFYSFESKTDDKSCQRFIELLVEISDLDDDDQIFDLCEIVLDSDLKGMQAASASVMLHCLKPMVFPILNANFGDGTIYEPLGIILNSPGKLTSYIANCRRIKEFRDANLKVKNYRILDRFPRKYNLTIDSRYFPSLEEYDPGITTQKYVELLQNEGVVQKQLVDTIFYIYMLGGEATCTAIANKYGNTPYHYNSNATHLAKAIQLETKCPMSSRDDNSGDRYWAILFQGRYTDKDEQGSFSWKLRQPLYEAIEELDGNGFFDDFVSEETKEMDETISKNLILYGPPGTGKTYDTVIYAVAIVEKKSVQEVQREALLDYESVKERFEDYKSQGRIAFTTFHQSYGYEEFIEGIRPIMDDSESQLEYSIEDGVFKDFCKKASVSVNTQDRADLGLNSDPYVWKVSLCGTYDNPVRKECMDNNHIRIGFNEYGEDISEEDNLSAPMNAFYNRMEIGDVVLSCYTAETIDAIGIITSDVEYHKEYNSYNRLRKVKWLVKGINENIVALNGGSKMVESTVYKMKIALSDVLSIVEKYSEGLENLSNYEDNYVFIIDEINRGPAVEVFGGSIVAIESDKRLSADSTKNKQTQFFDILNPNTAKLSEYAFSPRLYILAAMNQADVSVAPLDVAFLRRWVSVKLQPDYKILAEHFGFNPNEQPPERPERVEDIYFVIAKALEEINRLITIGKGADYQLGHGILLTEDKATNVNNALKHAIEIWQTIYTHIEELFFGDASALSFILNANSEKSPYTKKEETFAGENKIVLESSDITESNIYDLYLSVLHHEQ